MIGIVGDDHRTRPLLDEIENIRVERLRTVEQEQIDRLGQVDRERFEQSCRGSGRRGCSGFGD